MADLADKVEKIGELQKQPEEPTPVTPDVDTWKNDPDNLALMKHFNIDVHEANWYQEKLLTIHDWAKEKAQSKDIIDSLVEIKALQRELGMGSLEKSINEIYRWVRLDQDEKRIQKEKGLLSAGAGR